MNEFFMDPLIEWERDLDAIVKNALREAENVRSFRNGFSPRRGGPAA